MGKNDTFGVLKDAMQRLILKDLLEWKASENRKPLIIQGARQTGKTWIMKEFGAGYFEKSVYFNFETSTVLQSLFVSDFDIKRILATLEIAAATSISKDTLLIFDEIQEAPGGITALKYFFEQAPEYFIVAAGSFLGLSLQKSHTFPVGKVDFLFLYPLSFEEFLLNAGEERLLLALHERNHDVVKPFHEKLIRLLREYYFTGGMPEALNRWLEKKDPKSVREIQNKILLGYENDFGKYAPAATVPKIRLVWQSVVSQLSRENRKFVFRYLKKGARVQEFESAIQWLALAGLVHKCSRISKPAIPLKSYADYDSFKLFLLDVGLLNAMAGLESEILLIKNQVLTEYKGAMTEQFVAQELKLKYDLFYWSSDSGNSEIDFVVQKGSRIIPAEVKAEENLKSKSLRVYSEKYQPVKAMRLSMSFFRDQDWMQNVPLYATFLL
jgi:predicted AAA+ superfamily ATPase